MAVLAVIVVVLTVVIVLAVRFSDSGAARPLTTTVVVVPSGDRTSVARTTTSPATTTGTSSVTPTTPLTTDPRSNTPVNPVQYLMNFSRIAGYEDLHFDTGLAYVSGTPYPRSVMIDPRIGEPAHAEYDLGRNFTVLDGVLGIRDDATPTGVSMQVRILADGKILFDQQIALGGSVPLHLDVAQALRLRLEVTNLARNGDAYAVFGDLGLTPR
ncbi:NPCBM/NEW2 domain-containing protein [Nocardia seriolae]|uniref:Serine/threonine protein kinase n=1 Tax=Nocardia seriolae TaxID=37332 RepID=A0A0B8NP43_9NOCA|nr:NPCBM/NEW2 domain-containing protein [Nocardia seriolae]MTJ64398.1 hypothetical protein [Nocardia seriolae]MTJ75350.1 hypothetical protein [Nocardia seriolae]MTJ87608.1 hypothetical protein [Nocardia seriolae]MTK31601.1 hypothetical protein [Nocardia seriolae]MTK42263.1 hypothetical protein [Nocardia seriolae]